MPIAALPQDTVRVLTSSVTLHDAVSVVKELVDNSLDAGATSIVIEISNNTIDIIQVKDNGKGIGIDDRRLLCKKGCTSKIRTVEDLTTLGGRSLGFRGEALASTANISGAVIITTRIEGETVGTALKFGANGELLSSSSASHAVGTTVRVQDLLSNVPVRKQAVLKSTSKIVSSVRKLLFAYAFARPEVRFTFKVLKGKDDKANWNYAPSKSTSNLLEDTTKIIGKDAAGQLVPQTITSSGYADHQYTLQALLINAESDIEKACHLASFFSVDQRPVNADRDLMNKLHKLYKKYLRKALPSNAHSAIAKPFMCLRLACPPESYDINVEPAKDRVLFYHESQIYDLFEEMLKSTYGTLTTPSGTSQSQLATSNEVDSFDIMLSRPKPAPVSKLAPDTPGPGSIGATTTPRPTIEHCTPRATSEEIEDGGGQPSLDNPWTKAKMNVRLGQITNSNAEKPGSSTGTAHDMQSSLVLSLDPPGSPHTTPLPAQQLLTPGRSPDGHEEPYQNPGPPLRRRGPRVSDSEPDSPPPSEERRPTLVEEWIRASQQIQPRHTPARLASQSSLNEAIDEVLELRRPGAKPGQESSQIPLQAGGTSKLHHRRAPGVGSPQNAFMSPFKRPRLSQFPSSAVSSHATGVVSNHGAGNLPSRTPCSTRQRSEMELDEIMEFERQKKAIAQQRRLAIKALNKAPTATSDTALPEGSPSERRNEIWSGTAPDTGTEDFESQFSEIDSNDIMRRIRRMSGTLLGTDNLSTSLRRNRFLPDLRSTRRDASPALDPRDDSNEELNELNESFKSADTDPRACLLRQREFEHQQQIAQEAGHTRTGPKTRRVKTSRLPLETIPKEIELHNLGIELGSVAERRLIQVSSAQLQAVDEYIKLGETQVVSWTARKQDIPEWNRVLIDALKKLYPNSGDGMEIDLTTCLNHALDE